MSLGCEPFENRPLGYYDPDGIFQFTSVRLDTLLVSGPSSSAVRRVIAGYWTEIARWIIRICGNAEVLE